MNLKTMLRSRKAELIKILKKQFTRMDRDQDGKINKNDIETYFGLPGSTSQIVFTSFTEGESITRKQFISHFIKLIKELY
jgi:Ca2+-binding EF-hand superfamily protein